MMRFNVLMAGAAALAASSLMAAPEVGDKAPTMSAGGWLNLPEGMKTLNVADLKGRVVIIDFWATW